MKYQILRRLDGGMQMMEWDFALLIVVAVALFAYRKWRHEESVGDWLILAFSLLTSALIWTANTVSVGRCITFWRYHYPGYALLLGYCGYALASVCRKWPVARFVLAVLLAGGFSVMLLRPLRHGGHPEKYADESVYYAHCRAAEVIRRDWKGPERSSRPFRLHEYLSMRRPLVAAFERTAGYQCGGRSIELNLPCNPLDIPDYWLISDREDEVLLHWLKTCPEVRKSRLEVIDTGREKFSLYRTER